MEHHDVLVVGGGNGGISAAAKLLRDGFSDVAVVSPSPVHRYRPLLNQLRGRRRGRDGGPGAPAAAFAHAVPHYRAPRWIAGSGLAVDDSPGLVDIDPRTLRHRRHE